MSPSQQQIDNLLELYQAGKYEDAEKLAASLTEKFPKHPFSWQVLGAVLKQIGKINEALIPMQRSVQLSPQDAQAHNNLGITLKDLGRLEEAEKNLRQAIKLKPDLAEAYNNLSIILQDLGRLEEAEKNIRQAIKIKPNYAEAYNNLGNILNDLGRLEEAEKSYEQAIKLKPDYAEAYNNLGIILQERSRLEEAEKNYEQAIKINPNLAEAYNNLGNILNDLGRLEEAEKNIRQAIKLKPDFAAAHLALALIKKFNVKDEQYSKMLKIYLDKNTSEKQLCHINFGLAKVYEDLGDFKKAFEHYSEGNALRKKMLNYDINQDVEHFDKIKLNYPSILKNSLKSENIEKNLIPVFIVGMPRSGTTLVEQIISSHVQVTGAGELTFANQFGLALAKGYADKSSDSLINFRNKYLAKLQNIAKGNLIVTDKMPNNFHFIGLITAAFPEAKIVHVKRNAAAVCWGIYKQCFQNKKLVFSYATKDIVNNYKLYQNIMKFWESSLKDKIYTLEYELLVENQESETRQLIDYLGLDWDEKCLSPQNNTRSVSTASNTQVRKKIYQGSSQQWKKYQPFLNGVFDGL